MDQRGSTHFDDKNIDIERTSKEFTDKIKELETKYEMIPRKYDEERTRIVRDLNRIFNATPEERERMLEEQYDRLDKELEEIKNNLKLTEAEKEEKYKEIDKKLQEITYEINELPNKSQKEQEKYLENALYEMIDVSIVVDQRLVEKKLKELVEKRVAYLNRLYTVKGYKQEDVYEALKVMAEFKLENKKLNDIYSKAFDEALRYHPILENVYISYSEKNQEINFDVNKRVINVDSLGKDWEFADATLSETNVKVKGDVEAVKGVSRIEAYVDLSKLSNPTEGVNQLDEVQLVALDKDGNMLNVNIEPKTISANVMLNVLKKDDIQKPVEAELTNADVIGDKNELNVTLSSNSVKIKGDLASTVASVKAPIDVSRIGDPTIGEHTLNGVNLVAYDKDGNPVDVDLEPPVVDATLSISKKIEKPTDIEKNPKKTWQTWLALAAGIGLGAAVAFGVGPVGVTVMTVAGGIANKFVNKKRQQLRAQRLAGTLPVEEVIDSKGIKAKFEQLKRYMKSERGLRDLSWFLNGAIYSGLGFSLAKSIYGLAASKFGPEPEPIPDEPEPIPGEPEPIPDGPEPAPTDDIVLGESIGNAEYGVGYDSALQAYNGEGAENLLTEYINSESTFDSFAVINENGQISQIIDTPGISVTDFATENGIDLSNIIVNTGKYGTPQTWNAATQVLEAVKKTGGMTK